ASIQFLKNKKNGVYEIINIGSDSPISLRQLIKHIKIATNKTNVEIIERAFVKGEVTHTHADIEKARDLLHYNALVSIEKGINLFYEWYRNNKIKF
ncbi:MAG: hypothetical protein ACKVOM_00750, partial [Ferruginibacter sp.]